MYSYLRTLNFGQYVCGLLAAHLTIWATPGSIIHEAKHNGLIVLVSPNLLDRKGNNKVSKCKLKKYLNGNKTREKPANFATHARTITDSPLVP